MLGNVFWYVLDIILSIYMLFIGIYGFIRMVKFVR